MKKNLVNNISGLFNEPAPRSEEERAPAPLYEQPATETRKGRGRPPKAEKDKAFRYTFVTDPELIEELKRFMFVAEKRLIKDAINEAITEYLEKLKRNAGR